MFGNWRLDRSAQPMKNRPWVFLCRVLDQVVLERVGGCGGAARHVELDEDVGDMPCDGLLAEIQVVCNRPVRPAGRDKAQNLEFPAREAADGRRCRVRLLHTREIRPRTKLLECATGRIEFKIGAVVVTERATGLCNQNLSTSRLVRDLELAPERPRRTASRERGRCL